MAIMAVDSGQEGGLIMESGFLRSFFSIFKSEEKKRVESEWKQVTEQMRTDTESIRQFRENHNAKLQMAREKLMHGKEAMRARISLDSLVEEDGPND